MKKYIYVFLILSAILISPLFAADSPLKTVYRQKLAAVKTLKISEVSKYVTARNVRDINKDKDPKRVLFYMDYLAPENYTITDEQISGDSASFKISGVARNPEIKGIKDDFKGVVTFKKEGSNWKVDSENFNFKQNSGFVHLNR